MLRELTWEIYNNNNMVKVMAQHITTFYYLWEKFWCTLMDSNILCALKYSTLLQIYLSIQTCILCMRQCSMQYN